jgi:hypothetical protein
MIGVIADPSEEEVVREFFELFKTPWEFYRADRSYTVLLAAGDVEFNLSAKLVVVYGGRQTKFDEKRAVAIRQQSAEPSVRSFDRRPLPLYGESVTFDERGLPLVQDPVSGECVAFLELAEGRAVARIGYDLFQEVRALLTTGQPIVNAAEPALELHIALLRDVITRAGVPLVEIPAVPDGFQFIACLTHDVDHPTVRAHKWDHTVWGFIYRATFGSLQRLVRGEIPFSSLLASWLAVAKLPFVYMGLASDFWGQFGDCYLNAEGDLPSTFFVIPRKNDPGKVAGGLAPAFRASKYAARDIAGTLQKLIRHGREVGLHGIDAWLDSADGATELAEVASLTGTREIGVRMHWLYFSPQSPAVLEKAGAAYDSTIGYNETVGYRAGTTQAFRPIGAARLLELPLHVMDTSLFYPGHLGLSPKEALTVLLPLVDNASRHGGVLTINWHDRSLAPERLWDSSYRDLIDLMKSRGAWFATAGQAVTWFRKRRSVVFETEQVQLGAVRAKIGVPSAEKIPGLRLRTYKADSAAAKTATGPWCGYSDAGLDEPVELGVS